MYGSRRQATGTEGPPAGPRYRRHLAEQPRPAADPFSTGTDGARSIFDDEYGPEVEATFASDCDAYRCTQPGGEILPGDIIRADGENGWVHTECAEAERDA